MTYGDGVAQLDVRKQIAFHHEHGCHATVTAAQPPGRFGVLETKGDRVLRMKEKPPGEGGWINGGFFVLSPKVLDLIEDDHTIWESWPMQQLAAKDQLRAYRHAAFWHPMDTLRDRQYLDELWLRGRAPWKVWE
jgi:glucose-1-phosphate cytidylyltransferase